MTGDYAEQTYGCPFDSIGCCRCNWSRRGLCELALILSTGLKREGGE